MTNSVRVGRPAIRFALGVAMCAGVAFGISLTVSAGQLRSITDGVYSSQQAERGRAVYQAQCESCHGDVLQGAGVGPPLTGDAFMSNWSARQLSDVVDKIQKTMPFYMPGSLSRQQSTDLTAYILQTGKFPAGKADLSEGLLTQIALPMVRVATPSVVSGTSLPQPQGTLAEFMRAVAFYNANIIFNLQLKDPSTEPKKPMPVPFDYVQWGYTMYPGWLTIDQAAVAITDTTPLLLTPGRLCQNGRPAPVDREDWKKYVADLVAVGKLAYQTAKTRNYEAMLDVSDKLNDACAACHKVYRDVGGTEGSGGDRCRAN
jgi:mono/diheme cytochrome c family protein